MDFFHILHSNIELIFGFAAGKIRWGLLVQRFYYTIEVMERTGRIFKWFGGKTKRFAIRSFYYTQRLYHLVRQKV